MTRPLRRVPWIRPPAVYRPGRRVSPKREPGTWIWRADSWIERMDAYLWERPVLQTVLGGLAFAVFLLVCAWLLLAVPEGRP